MMKKMIVLSVLLVSVCALLAGCFASQDPAQDNPGAMPTPGPTASTNQSGAGGTGLIPGLDGLTATPAPGSMAGSAGDMGNGSYDWATQAAAVEKRIGMFSEVEACRVVVNEGTALVGLRFADAYQGELTQRIRDMVAGEVMAVDNAIQVVAVTAESQDVNEIFALADQQRQGNAPSDLKQKIDQIARNTTTLR